MRFPRNPPRNDRPLPVRAEGRILLACLFLLFPACAFLSASRRLLRAPPQEAARVTFPLDMHTHE